MRGRIGRVLHHCQSFRHGLRHRYGNHVALDDVSLALNEGEVLGLVGESGSGKSTLAHVLVRLTDITAGTIRYRGKDVTNMASARAFSASDKASFRENRSSGDGPHGNSIRSAASAAW